MEVVPLVGGHTTGQGDVARQVVELLGDRDAQRKRHQESVAGKLLEQLRVGIPGWFVDCPVSLGRGELGRQDSLSSHSSASSAMLSATHFLTYSRRAMCDFLKYGLGRPWILQRTLRQLPISSAAHPNEGGRRGERLTKVCCLRQSQERDRSAAVIARASPRPLTPLQRPSSTL